MQHTHAFLCTSCSFRKSWNMNCFQVKQQDRIRPFLLHQLCLSHYITHSISNLNQFSQFFGSWALELTQRMRYRMSWWNAKWDVWYALKVVCRNEQNIRKSWTLSGFNAAAVASFSICGEEKVGKKTAEDREQVKRFKMGKRGGRIEDGRIKKAPVGGVFVWNMTGCQLLPQERLEE